MNTVRAIQKLNKRELEAGISPEGSWHTDYRDTAFIYVGGLPFELSEGDIITLFSQYGEPVWIKLARDKETGKSRGFCWLKYEDQRSTDLAVDNMGGAQVLGRTLRVDHTRYKPRDDEDMRDNTMGEIEEVKEPEKKRRRRGETESETESEEERPLLQEEIELRKLIRDLDDDDPMKGALVKRKREEAEVAVAKYEKARRKQKERSRRRDRHRDRPRDRRRDSSRDRRIDRRRDESTDRDEDRHRTRSKDRQRDRSRDRGGERRRDKSRDRDSRRRSRSRDRDDRHRSRSRDHRDRPRDRSKSRGYDSDQRRGDRD